MKHFLHIKVTIFVQKDQNLVKKAIKFKLTF